MRAEPELLARDAESLFWMARYLERVENLARLIDVAQSFESPGREAEAWSALLSINADAERFAAADPAAHDPEAIRRFYLLDAQNPTSVPYCLAAARTNARTLRSLISTEMWRQINMFHRFVSQITAADLDGDRLSRLCVRLRESVQAHTGITEGTMYRGQGWQFYMLGRLIERADQITRLLDIKYHILTPRGGETGKVVETTQWYAVLRAAAGYQAFRQISPARASIDDVVGFLLRDPSFPRSLLLCVRRIEAHLGDLSRLHHLRGLAGPLEQVEYLREFVFAAPTERLLTGNLHEYLDQVQVLLMALAASLGRLYFRDWRPQPVPAMTEPYQ